jgi:replicative DNA helicase
VNLEKLLISKVISTGNLQEAVSQGIRSDLFADDECRDMFDYLLEHVRRYKTSPSLRVVKTDRPKFEHEEITESLDWLIDKFKILAKRRLANEMVLELAKACDDPERAANIDIEFLEVSRRLATLVPSTQVNRFKADMDKRIDDYEAKVKKGEPTGVPFGFPTLDEWTGGMQPHEFATVAGFSSVGKSSLLMATGFNAFMVGKTPLYISLEMESKAILRRWDAMAASLDYTKMKQLQLPPEQLEKWKEKQASIASQVGEIPVIDSLRNCNPDHIFAEAVRYQPDLIIVDYLGLMRTSRGSNHSNMWQSITEITQDLKQVARTLKIPILAAAQTNRAGGKEGAELDNVGGSLSIIQDSDIVIGLFADDDMKTQKEMEIRLRKNRDGKIGEFRAVWDHEKMEYRQKTLQDTYGRSGTK